MAPQKCCTETVVIQQNNTSQDGKRDLSLLPERNM